MHAPPTQNVTPHAPTVPRSDEATTSHVSCLISHALTANRAKMTSPKPGLPQLIRPHPHPAPHRGPHMRVLRPWGPILASLGTVIFRLFGALALFIPAGADAALPYPAPLPYAMATG